MRYVAYHGLLLLLFTQCATSNLLFTYSRNLPGLQQRDIRQTPFFEPGSSCTVPIHHRCRSCYHTDHTVSGFSPVRGLALQHSLHAAILFLFQANLINRPYCRFFEMTVAAKRSKIVGSNQHFRRCLHFVNIQVFCHRCYIFSPEYIRLLS